MHRLILAFQAFFRVLFSAEIAQQVEQVLKGTLSAPAPAGAPPRQPAPEPPRPAAPVAPAPKAPARSDALTVLAALQREGRLVDFLKESLEGATDAQIAGAVRDVHRDCAQVLERMFAFRPVVAQEEGSTVEVSSDAERFRLVGNVTGSPPFRGTLVHAGWEASKCELPTWSGSPAAARVVAPAEVELR
jgi:hypothetical protein